MNKLIKRKTVVNRIVSLLFLGCLNSSFAQNYTHQALIDSVFTSGMHRMELTPEIRSHTKADMSDLRIIDSAKTEVPYIIINEPIARAFTDFFEYKILSKEIKNNRYTKLIIEKTSPEPISNISLCIANAYIIKECRLSGSDDMKQWYAVIDNQELSSLYDNTHTTIYKSIYFPSVAYRYYQILINDSNSSPLNISKAGYFKGSIVGGKMLGITTKSISTIDDSKEKKTRISVLFNDTQLINRISFKITEPKYFKRNAHILVKRQRNYKKKTEEYTETLSEFVLNSDMATQFDVPNINEKEFLIEVDNLDNPPLKILNVKFEQLAASLIADLKANGKYKLVMGDKGLHTPQYDLDYFKDKIPQQLPIACIRKVDPIVKLATVNVTSVSFWQQKWFMWVCIAVGALLIFLFSFNLLKEMQSKKEG